MSLSLSCYSRGAVGQFSLYCCSSKDGWGSIGFLRKFLRGSRLIKMRVLEELGGYLPLSLRRKPNAPIASFCYSYTARFWNIWLSAQHLASCQNLFNSYLRERMLQESRIFRFYIR